MRIVLRVDSVEGNHVRCSLFMGDNIAAKCGDLCFRRDEYLLFCVALSLGAKNYMKGHLVVEHKDDIYKQAILQETKP